MAYVNRRRRLFKAVSIRSAWERFGFKAEHKVGESLTRDRFILCSGAMAGVFGWRFFPQRISHQMSDGNLAFPLRLVSTF